MQHVEEKMDALQSQLDQLQNRSAENKLAMVVFSGDLDKVLAALVIATGAVAMGMETVLFFTFWGTPVLRDKNKTVGGKDIMGNMFGAMLPKGPLMSNSPR
jgi:peroxiredoxin family protein